VTVRRLSGRLFSILNDFGFQNIINLIKHTIEDKSKTKILYFIRIYKRKFFEETDKIRKEIYKDVNNIISIKIIAVT